MSWFCISKNNKVLATNVKRVEHDSGRRLDKDGTILETLSPSINVISSDEVYVDPTFKKAFNEITNKKGDK